MDLGIWNKNWIRNEIWKNKSLSGHVNFLPKFRQKTHRFGLLNQFGTDLAIPNIWLFGHLDKKNKLWQVHIYTDQKQESCTLHQ
jgi:hypothetical protein